MTKQQKITREITDRFEQAGYSRINRLLFIGATHQNDLSGFIYEIDASAFSECFPDIVVGDIENLCDRDFCEALVQLIYDANLYGFLAEVYVPKQSNFRFNEDGSVSGASFHEGYCTVVYVYGETMIEVVEKVEIEANKLRNIDITKERAKTEK